MVGACLAISGAAFQSIFKNPLVSSDLLGVSNGAGFGAALGILLSGANIITQIFAFIFGLISVAATYLISKSYKAGGILVLVLSGVAISAFFNSLISAIKFIADPDDKLPEIVAHGIIGINQCRQAIDDCNTGHYRACGSFGIEMANESSCNG